MKINKTEHVSPIDVKELESFNDTMDLIALRQAAVDSRFERSATSVFVTMLTLSIATFFAAFFQV